MLTCGLREYKKKLNDFSVDDADDDRDASCDDKYDEGYYKTDSGQNNVRMY